MTDDRMTLRLFNPVQARQEVLRACDFIKSLLLAGHRLVLEVRPETRSDAQNRVLHSRLNDIANQCEWAGSKRHADVWKRLFTSAWLRTQGEQIELLPALDGHGVDIVYASTTKLSRRACAELSESILAWGTERGVTWCIASLCGEVDEEAGEIHPNAATAAST